MTEHAAHCADCFDILPNIADATVDFVFADLPYGTTQNKWDTPIDLPRLWGELNRVCKRNAAMVFTCQQPFTTTLIASNLRNFRYNWVWEKPHASGHLNAKRMPMKAHEDLAVFYLKLPTYNPQKTTGHAPLGNKSEGRRGLGSNYNAMVAFTPRATGNTTRYPRTVQVFANAARGQVPLHPTQKPLALVEYMIETYTNPGEIVLDPTAGVLTTRVAAQQCGRRSIVIEKEREYFTKGMTRTI